MISPNALASTATDRQALRVSRPKLGTDRTSPTGAPFYVQAPDPAASPI